MNFTESIVKTDYEKLLKHPNQTFVENILLSNTYSILRYIESNIILSKLSNQNLSDSTMESIIYLLNKLKNIFKIFQDLDINVDTNLIKRYNSVNYNLFFKIKFFELKKQLHTFLFNFNLK